MKRIFISLFLSLFIFSGLFSQTVRYAYDSAGNRTSRVIKLNDSSDSPSQRKIAHPDEDIDILPAPLIDYLNESKIKIYPNPTKGRLVVEFIDYAEIQDMTISVYDMSGTLLLNTKVNSSLINIDLSSFSTRTYIMKISSAEESTTWKIIKE